MKRTIPPRWRPLLLLLLLPLLALMVWELSYVGQVGGFGLFRSTDFSEYWSAARLLWQRENPYDRARMDEIQMQGWPRRQVVMMYNPPWILVPFLPILLLPYTISIFAWMGVHLVLLLGCATLLWKLLAPGELQRKVWLSWLIALTFMPALFTLRNGQVSMLLLSSVVGFFYFSGRRQDVLAGAFLALASVKVHVLYLFLLVVAWWVVREGRWRIVLGLAAAMAGWIGLLLLIAPHSLADYWQAVALNPPVNWRTGTLGGALRVLLGPQYTWLQFLPAVVTGLVVGLWLLWRRPALAWERDLAPILFLSALTAAYGWSYDQVVLLPAYLLLIGWAIVRWKDARGRALLVLLGLLVLDAALFWQNQVEADEVYLVWAPFALALLYFYGRRALAPAVPARSAAER